MQFNGTLWISCNSTQFYLKNIIFRTFFHENNDFKKHEIAPREIILPTNWLIFFVYSTNLVCKMNNCIIPLMI